LATQVHVPCQVTAISILRAIVASAANPLSLDSGPAIFVPALESGFRGQLDEAIQAWAKVETKDTKPETKDTKQVNASDDEARKPAAKDEDRPQLPALVAVVAVALPAPPPASLGLPAIGIEPGSSSGSTPDQTEAIPNVEPAVEPPAKLPVNPPAPPVEAAPPDRKADLSFAMRLVSLIPEREAEPKADATPQQMQMAPRLEIRPQIESAPAPLPDPVTEAPKLGPVPPALAAPLEPSSRPGLNVQPERVTTAAPQSAVPAVHRAAQQDSPAADSEPRRFEGGASEKEPAEQPAKPAAPPGPGDTPPEIESKPLHESAVVPAASNSGPRETPLPTAIPVQTAAVSASTTQTPAPAAAAPAVELAAAAPPAIRSHPTSEVTDVSVTLPVPRADSAGEDRVAIRMVQKGAEIHVSVRTPDHQLSQTMRQDIGRLATGLDEAGFRTESWRPIVTGVAASSQSSQSHEFSRGAQNRDTPSADARSGGREGRSPGEHKRRQPDERPRWVLELEQHKNQ
jgi:hypothetical protein